METSEDRVSPQVAAVELSAPGFTLALADEIQFVPLATAVIFVFLLRAEPSI